jgi:hypothetical protein
MSSNDGGVLPAPLVVTALTDFAADAFALTVLRPVVFMAIFIRRSRMHRQKKSSRLTCGRCAGRWLADARLGMRRILFGRGHTGLLFLAELFEDRDQQPRREL